MFEFRLDNVSKEWTRLGKQWFEVSVDRVVEEGDEAHGRGLPSEALEGRHEVAHRVRPLQPSRTHLSV